ncbi:MAG: pyrimidine dimer DNA glycosylase/endonuclease V [Patescibacteria group bacterium]|nr:pyrimidine dimer DNA glycosylase/endonuclease V [Patescibacteria group bacterium]
MRLWSLHPKYLDTKGLLATWREGLLAKKVLQGKTKGYQNHPQLIRFKNQKNPLTAINAYLYQIFLEAKKREYNFNKKKIEPIILKEKISVNSSQVSYEFLHLLKKIKIRDKQTYNKIKDLRKIEINPVFKLKRGEREDWEKIKEK